MYTVERRPTHDGYGLLARYGQASTAQEAHRVAEQIAQLASSGASWHFGKYVVLDENGEVCSFVEVRPPAGVSPRTFNTGPAPERR